MKALIDTHVFLSMATEPEKLSDRARDVCRSETLVLSVASIWEVGIKYHIGRLALPESPAPGWIVKSEWEAFRFCRSIIATHWPLPRCLSTIRIHLTGCLRHNVSKNRFRACPGIRL